jgi:hypothetical protein
LPDVCRPGAPALPARLNLIAKLLQTRSPEDCLRMRIANPGPRPERPPSRASHQTLIQTPS